MDQVQSQVSMWREPRFILSLVGLLALTGVITVAILRDRIVNQPQWQVSVTGQGRVAYTPNIALVSLGVQVDRQFLAEAALRQLNDKVTKVLAAVKAAGIAPEDIQTQAYTLLPQYDYNNGVSIPAGYSANQQLVVKVRALDKGTSMLEKVIAEATKAGSNQVNGISFDVSNLNDLKQEARIRAIDDAKTKAGGVAGAAGVRLGNVIGWWENVIQAPGIQSPMYGGMGGGEKGAGGPVASPVVPSGSQEIIVEVNLNYRIK